MALLSRVASLPHSPIYLITKRLKSFLVWRQTGQLPQFWEAGIKESVRSNIFLSPLRAA